MSAAREENVPSDRPAFFVGRHAVVGVLDVPLIRLGPYMPAARMVVVGHVGA
jgi:hypothetical protein